MVRCCSPLPLAIAAGGLFIGLFLAGCSPRETPALGKPPPTSPVDIIIPGVVHRAIADTNGDGGGMDVIDIDLARADCHLAIETRGITRSEGRVIGQPDTPRDWLTRLGGLAAVNGGYFGAEDAQGRKEFVGLLVQKGVVRHAAPPVYGLGGANTKRGFYVRSAFGLTVAGKPTITWAATVPGKPQSLRAYNGPMSRQSRLWRVTSAVGCGPMLIFHGKAVVTDSQERLVSPLPVARTFVAYDSVNGQPKHLLIGMASGATFPELAAFLTDYFPRYDETRCDAAMCLDGGASTQLTYHLNGALQSPRETGVTVPDALVLLPGSGNL